ncbi:MAG: sulfotransferase [Pleurocapsa sp. MO_226.B13]|nr:sulfotransferase [Pleurocapsa sp. MO_226.B13]
MPNLSQPVSQKKNIYPRVLVVGMSRTGTDSMKRAMEILYGEPAYHMSVVLNKPQHLQFWSNLAFGLVRPEEADWQQVFQGFVATTDMPSAYYFEHIAKTFPEAKVILTLRDEQEWIESHCRLVQATLRFRFIRFLPPLNRFWPFAEQLNRLIFGEESIDNNVINQRVVLTAYRNHNERVRQIIPAERLLEFNVQKGWSPLCEFLGVQTPSTPFPHRNAGGMGPTKILANAVSRLSLFPVILMLSGLLLIAVILFWL